MSRLDDLIDLIQTVNEIYLVNPDRNVRTAYILIDDLCELSLKSYLQANDPNWQPTTDGHYKGFHTVVGEAKTLLAGDQTLEDVLDRFFDRRGNRNRFFHNETLTGLTITPENCLNAFCDLYELMAELFPDPAGFHDLAQAKPIFKIQMAVIRLKQKACQQPALLNRYDQILRGIRSEDGGTRLRVRGELLVPHGGFAYEHCVVTLYAVPLYSALAEAGLIDY